MKNIIFMTILFTTAAWVVLTGSELSCAEEVYKNFSLGYGSLNSDAIDAKAPSPGVLTAKYGFRLAKDFLPYIGTGLAYSMPPEARPGDTALRVKTGVAGQAGFRFRLGEDAALNLDYKYLLLHPDTLRDGFNAPPQSLGVGLDIKF
jgi:outer membrane protein